MGLYNKNHVQKAVLCGECCLQDRTHLKTSDDELAAAFGRVVGLMQTVFRKPEFSRRMTEAMRLNWIQALESFACEP